MKYASGASGPAPSPSSTSPSTPRRCWMRSRLRWPDMRRGTEEMDMNHVAMAQMTTTGGELPAYRLRRVAQHIRENLQQELRLADLSAVVHMSPFHFARLFKRSTGVPPHQFLLRHRIEEARGLLAAHRGPVAQSARSRGSRAPSQLSQRFLRVTGL